MTENTTTVSTDQYELTTYHYDSENWERNGEHIILNCVTLTDEKAQLIFKPEVDLSSQIDEITDVTGSKLTAKNQDGSQFPFSLERIER